MQLTYAEKIIPEHDGIKLPERYKQYAIKLNGKVIGEIRWTYYPKNAGGSRWKATYEERLVGDPMSGAFCGADDKVFKNVLPKLRAAIERSISDWEANRVSREAYRARRASLAAKGLDPEMIDQIMWEEQSIGDAQT